MTWVKLPDEWADSPEMIKAGPVAKAIAVDALSYSARHLTDGFVPNSAQIWRNSCAHRATGRKHLLRLVVAGFWVEVEGGYQIVEWEIFLQKAADVKEKRAAAAARQKRWYDRKKAEANGKPNGVRTGVPNATPSPDPAPKGRGERGGSAGIGALGPGGASTPSGSKEPGDPCMICSKRFENLDALSSHEWDHLIFEIDWKRITWPQGSRKLRAGTRDEDGELEVCFSCEEEIERDLTGLPNGSAYCLRCLLAEGRAALDGKYYDINAEVWK